MMSEAASMILAMTSKCAIVIKASSRKPRRTPAASTTTMAKPEYIAPTTKYGGKIVSCQPGIRLAAKSMPTTLWSQTTSGTPRAAKVRCRISWARQCRAEPRHPNASAP